MTVNMLDFIEPLSWMFAKKYGLKKAIVQGRGIIFSLPP